MRQKVSVVLAATALPLAVIEDTLEIPKDPTLGDFAFPCFILAKSWKKSPAQIAQELVKKIGTPQGFERIEAVGPYINFFIDARGLAEDTLKIIEKEKEKYGSNKIGKNRNIVIDMSSPNIAKPFGIGHLRSTIIGNSLAHIVEFNGYTPVKINYLGDWGTQFGKMIVGYKRIGNMQDLKKDPMHYMFKLYIEGNKEEYEQEARNWFKKLEDGNKETMALWKKFKSISLKNFNTIYKTLGVSFHVTSGESMYEHKMNAVLKELEKKGLLERDNGALIVNLEKYGLGVALIEKSDGTKLYITRDLAAAIDRYTSYKPAAMFYEVGQEQKLHFRQLFTILGLMGYDWAKHCVHVDHGLYLDKDGKKFATRKGKTVFMEDILAETMQLATEEIKKRGGVTGKELVERARIIAIAAIFYGDLKNYRSHDLIFDLDRFVSFEGDTGPYLLYSYARACSILRKVKKQKHTPLIPDLTSEEKRLLFTLSRFTEVVTQAYEQLAPNLIATYAYNLSQTFNEFYHACPVIGSAEEQFRLRLVAAFVQVLGNALYLLGIPALKEM